MLENMNSRDKLLALEIPAPPFPSCRALGKLFNLSFPQLYNKGNNSINLIELL